MNSRSSTIEDLPRILDSNSPIKKRWGDSVDQVLVFLGFGIVVQMFSDVDLLDFNKPDHFSSLNHLTNHLSLPPGKSD